MVDYNEAAIRFYIQKNGFTNFKREKDHYLILDKEHDAITLYKEVYEQKQDGFEDNNLDNERSEEDDPEVNGDKKGSKIGGS